MSPPSSVVQLVDAGGGFHAPSLAAFSTAVGLPSAGQGYQVVAVMGPQSSGKSTLLNALVSPKKKKRGRGGGAHATAWLRHLVCVLRPPGHGLV